ncbi:hypothetical protein GCM10028807_47050 [Spirosoma daeguense]
MKRSNSLLSSLLCLLVVWAISCKSDPPPTPGGGTTPGTTTKSSAKAITAFAFNGLNPAVTATIDATAKTISATVASGTDVTKLVPTITVSDKATVSPASGVAQDFSKAVTYTVTAEDGTTQAYTASVVVSTPVVSAGTFTMSSKALISNPDIGSYLANDGALIANNGKIYLLAYSKTNSGTTLDRLYEYDPATDKWAKKNDISLNRRNRIELSFTHTGKSYVGVGFSGDSKNTISECDFTREPAVFTTLGVLGNANSVAQYSYDAGKLYYYSNSGGWGVLDLDKNVLSSFKIDTYPGSARLSSNSDKGLFMRASNGKLLFLGTSDKDGKALANFELAEFDYVGKKWTSKAPSPVAKEVPAAVFVIGKKLYAQGYSETFVYDTDTDKWATIKSPSQVVNPAYLNVSDGKSIYFFSVNGAGFYQLSAN